MDTSDLTTAIDEAIDNGLGWLSDNAGGVFDASTRLDGLLFRDKRPHRSR